MPDNKFFANKHNTWGHKWGYKDSSFVLNDDRTVSMVGDRYELSGTRMPDFIPYIEEALGITVDPNDKLLEVKKKPVTTPNVNEAFIGDLKEIFSEDQFSQEDEERLIHSHGQTTSEEVYKVLYNSVKRCVDLVIYVESETDVQHLIKLAARHDVCLVPFGGGTNVTSALMIPELEHRMVCLLYTSDAADE